MIAKIGRSSNLYSALAYNQNKVSQEKGSVLDTNKMIETVDGRYTMRQLLRSFEPYLIANRNTEKTALHISLNPDPKDQVTDEQFIQMASDYMNQMGYGQQPFIVFKHSDIERGHIHIVTVCVDENGKKISDRFEKKRSMHICRELERKYGLIPATEKERNPIDHLFLPVNYSAGNVKSQIASVVQRLPNHYKYQSLGEYNALLSLFNISTTIVESEWKGHIRRGLMYLALNEKGETAGHPIKASLLGESAGLPALELYFAKCKTGLKDHPGKQQLKAFLISVTASKDEKRFKKLLMAQDITVVVRRNGSGRIYGMTFIDHHSGIVCNGSRLGKELAANSFNEYWNKNRKPDVQQLAQQQNKPPMMVNIQLPEQEMHLLFDFLSPDQHTEDLIQALGGLIPEIHSAPHEEQVFENCIKKKGKRKKRQQ